MPHAHSRIDPARRAARYGHPGGVLWFTGLPGSGKSTLSTRLEEALFELGYNVFVLDGDVLRRGLNADLGFSPAERTENIRRTGEVAALFADAGYIVITAFISPYREDRQRARRACRHAFAEIYIKAAVETCEERDPKGHYRKARRGEIPEFTGVSAPYEAPDSPDLIVRTDASAIDACVSQLVEFVLARFGDPGGNR